MYKVENNLTPVFVKSIFPLSAKTHSAKHILPILDLFNGNLYVYQLLTYAYHCLVYILFTF